MPYIEQTRRNEILTTDVGPTGAGELTFALTEEIDRYHGDHGLTFVTIANVIAALEATKLEYYRRVVARYEGVKAIDNGDVYVRTNALLAQVRPASIQSTTTLAAENAKAEARRVAEEAAQAAQAEPIYDPNDGRTLEADGVQGIEGGGFGGSD
jgi:hypothetical protein